MIGIVLKYNQAHGPRFQQWVCMMHHGCVKWFQQFFVEMMSKALQPKGGGAWRVRPQAEDPAKYCRCRAVASPKGTGLLLTLAL